MAAAPDNDALLTALCNEYNSFLESTTILAVVLDYDLTDPAQLEAARNTLDFAKEGVPDYNQNPTHSDETASRSIVDSSENLAREDLSARCTRKCEIVTRSSLPTLESTIDEPTKSQSSSDRVVLELQRWRERDAKALDGFNEEAKVSFLIEMFPALKSYDITHAIGKYNGDVILAIDELMTQSFLEESGDRHRGIDGFVGRVNVNRQRKRKGKRKEASRSTQSVLDSPPSTSTQDQSSWDVGQQNIEFLAEKVRLPRSQIAALYYECGASMPKTVTHLTKEYQRLDIIYKDDPIIQAEALKLYKDYPTIALEQLVIICRMTFPDLSNASIIAKYLLSDPVVESTDNFHLKIRHAPPTVSSHTNPLKPNTLDVKPTRCLETKISVDKAADLREARNTAFAKASAAYRRGKSDHLMGAVATYYAEQGHSYSSRMKKAQSEAAESLVESQSSQNHLDLHGVNVKDAVRIARERVTNWWHELGEAKISSVRHEYKVITGIGTHSEGGRSRIGPAVAKMLIREGWKVEIGTGFLIVTGVAKNI